MNKVSLPTFTIPSHESYCQSLKKISILASGKKNLNNGKNPKNKNNLFMKNRIASAILFFTYLLYRLNKRKNRTPCRLAWGSDLIPVVDPRGVEPLSESLFIQPSPSAVYLLEFPAPIADKQAIGLGSFFIYDSFKSERAVHIYR